MYVIVTTSRYRSSFKRISRQKDFNRKALEKVIDALARGEKLAPRYHDHQLSGTLKEFRECHVQNDLLLVYQKHDNLLILSLVDIGTHSSLFG